MSLWRIRVTLSDDRHSQDRLRAALAGQRVWSRLSVPRDAGITADVIIELPGVDGLDALLGELHRISPQVFLSSADKPSPATVMPGRIRSLVTPAFR
jgi:hypothetical protein